MKKPFDLLAAILLVLVTCAHADPEKAMNKWVEKIKQDHFLNGCWGLKTMAGYYEQTEKLIKECSQLTPAFDMGIFDMDDDNDDYFGMASNTVQQFQYPTRVAYPGYPSTMPAHLHYPVTQGTVGASNPLNAWMTFYSPYPSLHSRSKRAVSAADKRKFVEDMANYKEQKMAKMGNLTCVLAKYGSLDANLQINLSAYTDEMWKYFAADEQPDPEWKEKLIDGYKNCYELSQNIPQSFLEMKGPVYKKFGRQKMFFKCCHKMENMMCVKKELLNWVEHLYGKDALNEREKYGLPKDKYDAAMMKFEIMDSGRGDVTKFIDEFMYGM